MRTDKEAYCLAHGFFQGCFQGEGGIKIKIKFYFSPFLTITSISG
jgi:hypothetical protein